MKCSSLISLVTFLALAAPTAEAQGLIWKLPADDGTWIRFEGDYTQVVNRPDSAEGNLTLTWKRWVTIKSVGRAEVANTYYETTTDASGNTVQKPVERTEMCRWIEIKVETGKTPEGVLDAGPGGNRVYKILVPESEIRGTVSKPIANNRETFASYIPFVKGYRKLGDEPATEMTAGVFDIYPVVSLMRHYRNLEAAGAAQNLGVGGQTISATEYRGSLQTETSTYRSVSSAELFRSDDMPFGVAKWTATVVTEAKGSTDPRSEYKQTATLKEELQAVTTGANAESDLLIN